jgi:Protein kinase domain
MSVDERAAERLGPYRLLGRLGEGGMGVVYHAVDDAGRQVALKVLRAELANDKTFRHRLAREVDTMRRIQDRNVAEILDADIVAERPYIVTRFIDGHPLEETVRATGPMVGRMLGGIAVALAEGIAAIHRAGVVHRDLKPNNVMLLDGLPVIIDFGIAHATDSTRLTQTGMIVGTPGYIAPEIVDGRSPGPEVDIYAWAATVAFAATGRSPFGTGSVESVLARIMAGRPDLAGVPSRLEPILMAALARDPARRPSAVQIVSWLHGVDLTDSPLIGGGVAGSEASSDRAALPAVRGGTGSTGPRPARVPLGWYKLLAYLVIGIVICLSTLAPLPVGICAVLAAWYLRAADGAVRSRRLPVRGLRDLMLAPLRQPGQLGRATLMVVPCLLYAGLAAGAVTGAIVLAGALKSHTFAAAGISRWGLATFTYVTLAGMGQLAPRRQLVRLISVVARQRSTTAMAVPVLAAVLLLAGWAAWNGHPLWWPVTNPYDHIRQLAHWAIRHHA